MRLPATSPFDAAARRGVATLAAVSVLGGSLFGSPGEALAVLDAAATGKCVVSQCTVPLARCLTSPGCAANIACINTCTGKPDESECQIKCGDLFGDQASEVFNKCAVTDKKCVPQKQDDGSYPVPMASALASGFKPSVLEGDWYISAGLNPAFDIFDCQLHRFETPSPTKLVGNLQWRIRDPIAGTNFATKYVVQTFEQDPKEGAILYNHDNEYLHYQDDWYVLAFKEEEYVLVYYRGSNDAWDGYGGAVLYSRSKTVPQRAVPEIRAALSKVGLKWESFTATDNSCKPRESRLEEVEADLILVETKVGGGLRAAEKELEKDAIAIEKEVEKDLQAAEKEVEKDVAGFGRGFSSVLRKGR